MKMKFLALCFLGGLLSFSLVASFLMVAFAADESEYLEVNLSYLATHLEEFYGRKVKTTGTVHSQLCSIYMFEDFWLSRAIPVVIRFANLSMPLENSRIEIFGIIDYCRLEGGFFYFNAHRWRYVIETLPEFPSLLFPLSVMMATVFSVLIFKKGVLQSRKRHSLN